MIATQVKFNKDITYSYDTIFDTLRITFIHASDYYYDEPYPNLLLRYDDDSEELLGVQIMNAKELNKKILFKYLPPHLADDVISILDSI